MDFEERLVTHARNLYAYLVWKFAHGVGVVPVQVAIDQGRLMGGGASWGRDLLQHLVDVGWVQVERELGLIVGVKGDVRKGEPAPGGEAAGESAPGRARRPRPRPKVVAFVAPGRGRRTRQSAPPPSPPPLPPPEGA
jgi:hypothetical protein